MPRPRGGIAPAASRPPPCDRSCRRTRRCRPYWLPQAVTRPAGTSRPTLYGETVMFGCRDVRNAGEAGDWGRHIAIYRCPITELAVAVVAPGPNRSIALEREVIIINAGD